MIKTLLTVFLSLFSLSVTSAQSLITYPVPAGVNGSKLYLVTVSQNNSIKRSFVYVSIAGNSPAKYINGEVGKMFNFTTFSFSGAVKINVTKLGSSASSATIRPNRAGIGTIQSLVSAGNSTVNFVITKPGKLSIEFNDDLSYSNPLMIFADSLEVSAKVPDKRANNVFLASDSISLKNIPPNKDIIYFQPGFHTVGKFNIPIQISQVYISGGAFIEGYLFANRKTNSKPLTINGRGVLSQSTFPFHYPDLNPQNPSSRFWYKALEIDGGSGHLIEGITLINGSAYYIVCQGSNSTIDNVNINGFTYNNDAITLLGDSITVKKCFIRDNEDALVFYASNINIYNCVFWQMSNSVIQLGWRPRSMKNNSISDCDVIHGEWNNPNDENVGFIVAMNAIKSAQAKPAVIENFTVSDIYFDTPILRFLDIRGDRKWGKSSNNSYTANNQPWIYKNFTFKNLHFKNNSINNSRLIQLGGFNQDNPLSNFSFINIFIDGKKLLDTNRFNNVILHKNNSSKLKLYTN